MVNTKEWDFCATDVCRVKVTPFHEAGKHDSSCLSVPVVDAEDCLVPQSSLASRSPSLFILSTLEDPSNHVSVKLLACSFSWSALRLPN